MTRTRALGLAAVLLAASACRGNGGETHAPGQPEPVLVGRWAGTFDQVEFFAGGRLLLRRGPIRATGRYEFVEPRRVLVTYEGVLASAMPGDYRVQAGRDSLALCETDDPARCIRYGRVTDPAQPPPPLQPGDPAVPRLAEAIRFDPPPPEARVPEAQVTLKQAYVLQVTYRAEHGAYAPVMDSLREVGWEPPSGLRYYHPPRVTQSGERLCIVMEPRDADLWPVHIDDEGDLGRGRVCN